jgi:two-component system chemotaxis sensor kinase CheA
MDDIVQEFVTETNEALVVLDKELVKFEREPENAESLGQIFRIMHTIKGTCGFLGLGRLERVAHAGEDVLGKFRDGVLGVSPEAVTLILQCLDRIRSLIDALAESGAEPDGDDSPLIQALRDVAEGKSASKSAGKSAGKSEVKAPAQSAKKAIEKAEPVAALVEVPIAEGGFPVAQDLLDEVMAAEMAQEVVPPPPAAKPVATKTAAKVVTQSESPAASNGNEKKAAETIRVGVDVLENLMALVSEMVLTRNQLLQLNRNQDDSPYKAPIQRLNRVTTDLQESVMKTRMQPIGNAWNKLPRIVRDLANELGKSIHLAMSGEDTELDRQVLEMIRDPLTHMVRNSADHGLEMPDEREAAGKPEIGQISLSARHEGGHIIIQISDDGRGLNGDKIRAKVLERGLATAEELALMDENQIHQFIMKPGFSTAEKITNVSGRGVGMDVVRSNIEKIGGTVEFRSVFGEGSVFTIKIPLTLAIVSALIVEAGGQRFAIPQIAVREVVRATGGAESKIETLAGAPVLRLRDRLLPLIGLNRDLGLVPEQTSLSGQVVVCRSGAQVFGIVVDRIADAEEIVVKPLSHFVKNVGVFSGNTILGDGMVILILDVNALASRLSAESTKATAAEESANQEGRKTENVILFRAMTPGLKAVPLGQVHRIERFEMKRVEWVQGQPTIQYREKILPLMSMEGDAGVKTEGFQHVLVFARGDVAVGLAIEELEGITATEVKITRASASPELVGSQVVGDRAADYVNADYFLNLVKSYNNVSNIEVAA